MKKTRSDAPKPEPGFRTRQAWTFRSSLKEFKRQCVIIRVDQPSDETIYYLAIEFTPKWEDLYEVCGVVLQLTYAALKESVEELKSSEAGVPTWIFDLEADFTKDLG